MLKKFDAHTKLLFCLFNLLLFDVIVAPRAVVASINSLVRACLRGGGGPQTGEVPCGASPHLSCKRDQIKIRDYMDRGVTPPKRVTSPTWGPPPACKQVLSSKGGCVVKHYRHQV